MKRCTRLPISFRIWVGTMTKLTKRYVESLTAPDAESILWDDELSGFGLRLYPSGRKVYVVQYKLHGRTRRKTLGKHGVVTADEARKDAKLVQADVARGADPSADRKARLRSPTIAELGQRFLKEHVALARARPIKPIGAS